MATVLEVEVRTVYGVDKIYPVNGPAKVLAEIAGTKTLSQQDILNAQSLGLVVLEVDSKKLKSVINIPDGGKLFFVGEGAYTAKEMADVNAEDEHFLEWLNTAEVDETYPAYAPCRRVA